MVNPYIDKYIDNKLVRYFSEDVDDNELIWHRDKKTRDVEVVSGDGWIGVGVSWEEWKLVWQIICLVRICYFCF